MNVKKRKIMLMMFTGLMILCFTGLIQGKDHDGYDPGDRYRYKGSNYYGYSSQYRHYPEGRRYHRDHYKDQRRIQAEARRNQQRIRKLERKISKLIRKRYHSRSRYKYESYTMRIRQYQWEISRLERRNRYLRGLLYRR